METRKEITGHSLALITIFIWGTTFISTKVLLRTFSPIEILILRFILGYFALLLVCPHRLKLSSKKQEGYFIAAGLCGITLYYLLENIALTYTLASNVGVIISITPMFTAILASLFLDGEKLKPQFFAGFTIAIAGIIIISFHGHSSLRLNPTGDILAILAAIIWAVYSILTKKISEFHYNTIQSTRRIFFYGLIFMLPAAFIYKFNVSPEQLLQPVNLFNLLFLGLGASALCFVTWNSAVHILGAVTTSIYIYIVPVVTVITSAIILREKITGYVALGIILTLAGLFLSENKNFAKAKDELWQD